MAARKSQIEFLPQEDWERSTLGKLLKWALNTGRYVIVFTELIVILALLSRFKLDRDLTDLNEEIAQYQAMIDASGEFENQFRFLQERVNQINTLEQERDTLNQVLFELSGITPINVSLDLLNVTSDKVSLRAQALETSGIQTLIANLENHPNFNQIRLSELNSEDKSQLVNFSLNWETTNPKQEK